MEFLALILEKPTGKEIAEFRVDASDAYFAQCLAAAEFEAKQRYQPRLRKHTNWYVDVVAL